MNNTNAPQPNARPRASALQPLAKVWDRVVGFALKRGLRATAIVMTLLAAALTYAGYSTFVSPNAEENTAIEAAIVKQEAENETNREVERTEPAFKAEFKKAVELYRSAQPLLPSNVEVSNVLAQVQMAAQKNGVTLTGLNATKDGIKSSTSDKLYERELPALVTGTHPQVMRFFEDVARLPRIVLIREFAETSLRQKVSEAFTLIAYNSPPPTEIPALPKEFGPLLSDDSTVAPKQNAVAAR